MSRTIKIIIVSSAIILSVIFGLVYSKYYHGKILNDGSRVKWHPNSTKISYVRGYDLYLKDLKTGEDELIFKIGNIITGSKWNTYDWFPDGRNIAYLDEESYGNFNIINYNLDTKESSVFVKNISTNHIDVSPDGKKILYLNLKLEKVGLNTKLDFSSDSGLFVFDIESSRTNLIVKPIDVEINNERASNDIRAYSWTPDSQGVIFQRKYLGPYYQINIASKQEVVISNEETKEIFSHCLVYDQYNDDKIPKPGNNIIPSPDGKKYLYAWQKSSFEHIWTDYYLKESKDLICDPK